MKKIIWMAALIVIVAAVVALSRSRSSEVVVIEKKPGLSDSPLNATYMIDNGPTTLVNGIGSYELVPGGGLITTRLFGEPMMGDLDADGDMDAAVWLSQQSGGTGTFYYVAAAINTENGYQGTNALLLGDRIAPQTLEIRDGLLIANYADRGVDEPFSVEPSINKSLYGKITGTQLVDVSAAQTGE